jgi:type IV pilus assembly protein PilQ
MHQVAPLLLTLALAASPAPKPAEAETRISIDVKDADVVDVVRLLAEVGHFQVVVDPGVACKLTLKLNEVPWDTVLDLALRSCGLGQDDQNGVVRIATRAKLTAEYAEERKLQEERRLSGPLRTTRYVLSYAKAQDMAPLIKKFLSPRGDVVFDARTNTLIVTDIAN